MRKNARIVFIIFIQYLVFEISLEFLFLTPSPKY